MKILAIDPGNEQSAFVEWDGTQVLGKGIIPNSKMLELIEMSLTRPIIEMVASYGMPVGKTVFDTALWVGRFYQAGILSNPELIYRKDIKVHLCGSVQAKDANIRHALIDRFGETGTKAEPSPVFNDGAVKMSTDMWAALAVAVTWWDKATEIKKN